MFKEKLKVLFNTIINVVKMNISIKIESLFNQKLKYN